MPDMKTIVSYACLAFLAITLYAVTAAVIWAVLNVVLAPM